MQTKVWSGWTVLVCAVALGCSAEGGSPQTPGPIIMGTAGSAGWMAVPGAGVGASGTSAGGGAGANSAAGASGASGDSGAGAAGAGGAAAAGAGGSAAGAGGAGGNAGVGGAGGPEPMRIAITIPNVAVMDEDHVCVTVALPNEQPVWIKTIHATLTPGSHHLIVDRETADATLQNSAQSCPPTQGGDQSRLIIAQQADTLVDLPEGTAFRLEARQRVFLQLHYFNYLGSTADIEGVVEFTLADESAGTPTEVRSLFTGQMFLLLPAGQATTAEFFIDPARTGPVRVFALTSHTHSLGVRSTIERVADESAADTTPIHESLDWAESPLTIFDPPLAFTGSDGLRLRCHYMNDTDRDVGFGTRFEDEMCFLWLYYYSMR